MIKFTLCVAIAVFTLTGSVSLIIWSSGHHLVLRFSNILFAASSLYLVVVGGLWAWREMAVFQQRIAKGTQDL